VRATGVMASSVRVAQPVITSIAIAEIALLCDFMNYLPWF